MRIGSMNHPQRDVVEEIHAFADLGLTFMDLTLEPPAAASWRVDPQAIRRALEERDMPVVGHTAYYLPIDSPFEEVRQGAVAELRRCLEVFAEVGAQWMNIHPGRYTPMHDRAFYIERNLVSLRELQAHGERLGVGLMIENLPGDYNTARQLGDLLDPMPELGLHLDIGHSNLMAPDDVNTADEILHAYGDRLRHVHIHDNKGGHADLHLPLGTGNLDVAHHVRLLKAVGYDGTITLEVFTHDRTFLKMSAEALQRVWDEA